jgi:hypothetical protein
MVETKSPKYWDDLSKKGEIENRLKLEVEQLKKEFSKRSSGEIFVSNDSDDKVLFTDEFTAELHQILGTLFTKHPHLTPTEIDTKRTQYFEQIYDFLHIIHIKKVACGIMFDAYSLLKLFSRICSIRIILNNPSFNYFGEGKCALNIESLKNILKCESSDKSKTTLQFSDKKLFISIKSEKFGSEMSRTLEYLDLELEPIPLETLQNIEYPFQFSLEQYRFIYTMKNLGIYSEITEIKADNTTEEKAIIFSESSQQGTGEVYWKRQHLINFQYNQDLINEEVSSSAHSLTFLKWIEEIAKVLERDDPVCFSIKDDHPIRIEIQFKKLGNSSLLYYLAPRALKNEDEDEDSDFLD